MLRTMLAVLDLFVGLTAVGGGLAMAAGIDRRVDPAWLNGTPFRSYRLPGALLATLVGGSALVAFAVLLVDEGPGAIVSVVAGAILAGWIAVEVRVLDQPSAPTATESLYFTIGVVMMLLGLAIAAG